MSWVLHTNDVKHLGAGLSWGTEPAPAIDTKGSAALAPRGREEQPSPQQFLLPTAVATGDKSRQFGTNVPLLIF